LRQWVVATRSQGKLRELRALFAGEGIAVIGLDEAGIPVSSEEDDIECYDSFEENALAKARYFRRRASGFAVIADDSGLEVSALKNAPGVRSRRWSGRTDLSGAALDAANNEMLAHRVRTVRDRSARFVCAAAFAADDREVVAIGEVDGTITDAPSGGDGFGYDPYFHVTELGMTLGVATVDAKERVSHRGRAFRALLARLRADGLL